MTQSMAFDSRFASRRGSRWWKSFGSGCFTVSSFVLCAAFLVLIIRIVLYHQSPILNSNMPSSAIIVLGGGLTSNGEVPFYTKLRVEKAVELYNQLGKDARIFPLSGGTPHKPNPVDSRGFPIWEACAASKALIKDGIPPAAIFEEAFSVDTIGNVYHSLILLIHLLNFDCFRLTSYEHCIFTLASIVTCILLPTTGICQELKRSSPQSLPFLTMILELLTLLNLLFMIC